MTKFIRVLLFPSTMLELKCPKCKGEIQLSDIARGFIGTRRFSKNHFGCRACQTQLQISTAYVWYLDISCQLMALAITAGVEVRPWYVFLIIWQLLHLILVSFGSPYLMLILPPRIMVYDPHPDLSLDL
jgi:hypothetical protein